MTSAGPSPELQRHPCSGTGLELDQSPLNVAELDDSVGARQDQEMSDNTRRADELPGQVALVTGASRGIGRASALALARAGADVAVGFREREDDAEAVRAEIKSCGRRTLAIQADVASANDVTRLVETVQQHLGDVDILVNNAGISRPQPLQEITDRDWEDVLTINLKSMLLMTQAVLPGIRKRRKRLNWKPL